MEDLDSNQDVVPEEEQDIDNGVDDSDLDSDKASQDANAESKYKEILEKKGFKSEEDLAKAYSELESHKGQLANDNKEMKDWIMNVAPFLQAINSNPELKQTIEEKLSMAEENEDIQNQNVPNSQNQDQEGEATPKDKLAEMYEKDPEGVTKLIKNMVGNEVKPLQQKQAKKEVADTLEKMRSDKEKYPYMDEETEKIMTQLAKSKIGQGIPLDNEGIQALYEIAIARRLDGILKDEREKATNEAYENVKNKNADFMESDEGSATGKLSNEDQEIIDGILDAGAGKSLI